MVGNYIKFYEAKEKSAKE